MIKSPNIITFGLYWKLINGGMIMANITAKDVAELRKQTGRWYDGLQEGSC